MRTLLVLPLIAALSLAACHRPEPARETPAERARAVSVVRVADRPIAGAVAASGDLIPREEAAVLPEVSGYRVAAVLADVGDYVKKGQTLVQLDPTLIRSQVAQAEGLAAQAEAQALQAEDQARRARALVVRGEGILSEAEIRRRELAAQAARAFATAQAASARDLRTRAQKLSVTAPVSGVVLERNVRPGDLSAGGATAWFRIARDNQIELAAEMSQEDLADIRPGQTAQVSLPGGAEVTGRVRLVSPQIDPKTKLGEVRILLPVRPDVRAGGFGRAVFSDAVGTALAVPETAIRYDADGAGVMVVGPDNKVRRVLVQTGQRGAGWVELLKGPPAGTRVVRNAAAFLLDGDLVRPVEGQVAAAAPAAKAARPAR